MLSPIQFHSLLVAAWFGPTLEAATCQTGGAPGAWSYSGQLFSGRLAACHRHAAHHGLLFSRRGAVPI